MTITLRVDDLRIDDLSSFLDTPLLVFGDAGYMLQAFNLTARSYPLILLVVFLWIAISYHAGGKIILKIAKARAVTPGEDRELFRLVENTALMAGIPMPKIYLINDESMNAFAAGCKPEDASVALTTGIVKKLNKTELQSVIAHELAHIGNRDTRLMMITVAGIGFFTLMAEFLFHGSVRGQRGRRRVGLFSMFVGFICLVFGYVIAPVLRLALSRRREYQADATAVKIIRDPEALARALAKIAKEPAVESLDSSPMLGNLCIVNPGCKNVLVDFVSRLYATHPPVEDRIAALHKMAGQSEKQQERPIGRAVW